LACYAPRTRARGGGVRLAGRPGFGVACVVAVAGLGLACASAPGRAPVALPSQSPPPAPATDTADAVVAKAEARLQAGLAAAREGHLDRARTEFDAAVDTLLSFPGGAFADPRVADAYRRTLDTVHVRELEMLAEGDGFTESGTEPASIDAVGGLPVGETPANPDTLARAVAAVEAESPDLPIELNEPVLSCIDLYQGRLRDWFETALSRGQIYLPHIRQVFAEEGIPQDLAYVALVESAFKTTAYSRAKAKGVWQFVSATGKRYGLAVDWWVDERSDPEKATRAAARYLKELHGLFGDWNLALAGYNAGEGKVLRAMKRYRTDDFWKLRETRGLRRETKNYVPLIHAAVVLAKAPERYGFTVTPDERPDFERVPIEGAIDLRVIAECAGEPVEDVRALNPELRRLATPADRTFALRVPAGRAQAVADCVAALPIEKRVTFRTHVVRRGQTFAGIARANGVTARDVAEANNLKAATRLRPGTELIIPIPARPRVAQARREAAPEPPGGRGAVRHRIQPGDTLASIAAQYGTTVRELQAWNGLHGSRIAAGDVLTIFTGTPN
jgi:membrane-bound lytic murein transglycosylase D